jgi:putative transposase
MPEYRRKRVPGGTFFFTINLHNRRLRLLTEHIKSLRKAFHDVQVKQPFHIDAAVVLPDHLHLLITLPVGDVDYSTRLNQIKGKFTRSLPRTESVSRSRRNKRERGIWQRRFWEHAIGDDDDYNHHVDYIHYNPVKHGHVARAVEWPYSSLHRYIAEGILWPEWGVVEPPRDFDWG